MPPAVVDLGFDYSTEEGVIDLPFKFLSATTFDSLPVIKFNNNLVGHVHRLLAILLPIYRHFTAEKFLIPISARVTLQL